MTRTKLFVFALFGAIVISVSPVFGDKDQIVTAKTEQISSECNIPTEFYDQEAMANTMMNPAKFVELMALFNNPQTSQALMQCSMDAEQWKTWMANMMNPGKMMNAMAIFMNPQLYTNWMSASMNPQIYQPMYSYMNPAFYSQWMSASMNPAFYQPMIKMMDPNVYQEMFNVMAQAPAYAQNTVTE